MIANGERERAALAESDFVVGLVFLIRERWVGTTERVERAAVLL